MTENVRPLKMSNRHPVDRLGEVREQIKALQSVEKELKTAVAELMGGADSLGGDEFIARQRVSQRKGALDEKLMAGTYGEEMVESFRKPQTVVYTIDCRRRSEAVE